ncbi:MAG: hypothetical protein QXP27_06140 [Candidatus Methanomethyliaceae archaeon]
MPAVAGGVGGEKLVGGVVGVAGDDGGADGFGHHGDVAHGIVRVGEGFAGGVVCSSQPVQRVVGGGDGAGKCASEIGRG